jgi:hypothetical protein
MSCGEEKQLCFYFQSAKWSRARNVIVYKITYVGAHSRLFRLPIKNELLLFNYIIKDITWVLLYYHL